MSIINICLLLVTIHSCCAFVPPYNRFKEISRHEQNEDAVLQHCLRPCPMINDPVCGYDGKTYRTFSSPCEMETQNCMMRMTRAHVFMKVPGQECSKQETEENTCDQRCTRIYRPICAFVGHTYKTFANQCVFEVENCLANYTWNMVRKDGPCHVDME